MKTTLTQNQVEIIENLKSEFLRMNESSNVKGNLINVSELLGIRKETNDFKEEIRIHNTISFNKRKEQLLADYDKIVDDIKALGLYCYMFIPSNTSCRFIITTNCINDKNIITNTPHHNDCIMIYYSYKTQTNLKLPDNSYHSKYDGIKLEHDNSEFNNIEECVTSEKFKRNILRYIK